VEQGGGERRGVDWTQRRAESEKWFLLLHHERQSSTIALSVGTGRVQSGLSETGILGPRDLNTNICRHYKGGAYQGGRWGSPVLYRLARCVLKRVASSACEESRAGGEHSSAQLCWTRFSGAKNTQLHYNEFWVLVCHS
jgi:hypothetical protein